MRNPIYLIKIDPNANNNKYYRMTPSADGSTFTVEYGRVDETATTFTYPIEQWDKKYREKTRKGYVDMTELVKEESPASTASPVFSSPSIERIVNTLMGYASAVVEREYSISSTRVTLRMVEEAQHIIDAMAGQKRLEGFNEELVKLFRVIPRRMSRVSDELARSSEQMGKILSNEQDLLDILKGQIKTVDVPAVDAGKDFLSSIGLSFGETTEKDVALIKSLLGEEVGRFKNAWRVENIKTRKRFEDFVTKNSILDIRKYWHGSRNENWWSILNSGLMLNPPAKITGKMFGNGIYFAPKARKSVGYTSVNGSYWARGNSNSAYMSLFDVAYGKPYDVYAHSSEYTSLTLEKFNKLSKGAHTLHAHEGSMLRNDEVIVYNESQVTVSYVVEII